MLYFSKIRIFLITIFKLIFVYIFLSNFIKSDDSFFSKKINLGLDLQGGSYLLLEIDNSPVITQKLQNTIPVFKKYFKERKINNRNFKIIEDKFLIFEVKDSQISEVKQKFSDDRRTTIDDSEFEADIEDLIQREDMVVTVTHGGYIKRVPVSTYRAQRRGGKGRSGMATRDEDFVSNVYVVNTHTPVLFFSSRGMVYKLKVYKLPLGTPQARGKALVNLLPLEEGETITTLMPLPEDETACEELDVMFTTACGSVRRNRLSDFVNVMANGKIAMKLNDGDHLVGVSVCDANQDILLSTAKGKCIRFPTTDVRLFAGRASSGVRGIKLAAGDNVMSMSTLNHGSFSIEERNAYLRRRRAERMDNDDDQDQETDKAEDNETFTLSDERYSEMVKMDEFILTLAANGYGKRTSSYEYTVRKRGGQGIANIDLSVKDNSVVASFPVMDQDQLVLVTDSGQMIRTGIDEIRIAGRSTRGVIVFRVADKEHVVSVSRLPEVDNDEENDNNEVGDEVKSAENSPDSDSEIENKEGENEKIQTDGKENV